MAERPVSAIVDFTKTTRNSPADAVSEAELLLI
jgi:hypothetical protein